MTLEALFVFSSTPCLTAAADQTPLGLEITAPPVKRMRPSRRRLPTRVSLFLTFRPWSSSLPLGTLSHIKWVSAGDGPTPLRGVVWGRPVPPNPRGLSSHSPGLTRPLVTVACELKPNVQYGSTDSTVSTDLQRQQEVCREGTAAP